MENNSLEELKKLDWHEVFEKGSYDFETKKEAISAAYLGWAHCYAGRKQPDKFGYGMSCISKYLGIAASEENLDKLVVEIKWGDSSLGGQFLN